MSNTTLIEKLHPLVHQEVAQDTLPALLAQVSSGMKVRGVMLLTADKHLAFLKEKPGL